MADMLASITSFGNQDFGRPETTEAMTSLAPEAGDDFPTWEGDINLVNHGINYLTSTGDRRISEPINSINNI